MHIAGGGTEAPRILGYGHPNYEYSGVDPRPNQDFQERSGSREFNMHDNLVETLSCTQLQRREDPKDDDDDDDDDGYPPTIKHGARPYILIVRQLARNRDFKSLLIISMCDFPASHV